MLALSVVAKIIMAVCALIVSVLGIAGVRSLRERPQEAPVLRLGVSRLTKAGWVLAICAIGIFVAGAANEILTFEKEKAASVMAEADRNGLQLVANNFSIPLMAGTGRMTFFGTKTTGGALSYRSSAEESACRDTARSLKDAQCELNISVLSEARWRFEDMESLRKPENAMLPALDACRRYEALYGETCADAVRRLTK